MPCQCAIFRTLLTVAVVLSAALAWSSTQAADTLGTIVIPAPTAQEFDAAALPKTSPMEIPEARAKLIGGVFANKPGFSFAAPGTKVAIIDVGFGGIKAWLDAHPQEKSKTHYVTDPAFSRQDTDNHGYQVYRMARAVLGMTDIYLYNVSTYREVLQALDDAGKKDIPIVNASIGWPAYFEIVENDSTKAFRKKLDYVLRKYEIFMFFSIGNDRDDTHAWISSDRENNGFVDFTGITPKGSAADAVRTHFYPGRNRIYVTWDTQDHPEAAYRLELSKPNGELLASVEADPEKEPGFLRISYEAKAETQAVVRLRRLSGPANGIFMRMNFWGPTVGSGRVNGLQTVSTYLLQDHPFLVTVGGVGITDKGTLAPTDFSDIGRNAKGDIYPHVLGPGKLMLDGKKISGTSFASPFLTAIYGLAVGYNIKNVIERTATFAPLDPRVGRHEASRWGVPEGWRIFFELKKVVGKTRVTDVAHRIEGDDVVISFKVSRQCMEGMKWWVQVALNDPQTNKPVRTPDGKPMMAWAELKSDNPDYIDHPVEVRIPLKGTRGTLKGIPLNVDFAATSFAWRGVAPRPVKFDEAPPYQINF